MKSGLPENNSFSIHTTPASSAVRSVGEILGISCSACMVFITAVDTVAARKGRIRNSAFTATNAAVNQSGAPNPCRANVPSKVVTNSGNPK